jgi:hypothetical protein
LVLIVLKDALNSVAPLELDPERLQGINSTLVHASYSADRRYLLTGHFGCRLLARDKDLWFTDCDTYAAGSGGPLLVQRDGELKLAAVMVGVAPTSASIAISAPTWIDNLAKRQCP